MPSMVQLQNVSKTFGDFTALSEVSFDIMEAEFMTFLGPSGCGKTTCLRLISGFETPSTGRILIAGKDVTADPPYKRDVNQVFQSYALFPHLTIRENIEFGLRMKKTPSSEITRRVNTVIEMTSLGPMSERKPSQLSGGQRQRVALARAIVCEPKVLLLDEPLSALDAKLRHQMQTELKQLQKRLGITFIFVTHDQEEALTMSDRVAVLDRGCVEQIGTVSEIYYKPATRFVASFIGETNLIEASILRKEGPHLLCKMKGGLEILARDDGKQHQEPISISIRPEKIRLSRQKPNAPNVFEGRITSEIFKGAIDDLTILAGDLELNALLANDGEEEIEYHEGENIFFRITPEDVSIVDA